MGKFNKGLFIGGLLGAGLALMNTTKKGKEVKEKMLDNAAEIYVDLRDKMMASKTWEKMTKQDFVVMAQEAVEKYAVKNGLADKTKKMITKLVSTQWESLQHELHKVACSGECKKECEDECGSECKGKKGKKCCKE
jgi:gas vesicle protein